jgi:Uma2 family endonuclease
MRVGRVDEIVRIPASVGDLESYRRWARSDDYPEKARVAYLRGEILVDPCMEQIYTHNRVKTAIAAVLFGIVERESLGQYFSDGVLISNLQADVANEPDGTFVSFDALRSGRVRCIDAATGGPVELLGSPDMVLEVVSPSTVRKDTVELLELYYLAGIAEYWLVDARNDPLRFDVFRRGASAFEKTASSEDSWVHSDVFARSFRLIKSKDEVGDPRFALEVR